MISHSCPTMGEEEAAAAVVIQRNQALLSRGP